MSSKIHTLFSKVDQKMTDPHFQISWCLDMTPPKGIKPWSIKLGGQGSAGKHGGPMNDTYDHFNTQWAILKPGVSGF